MAIIAQVSLNGPSKRPLSKVGTFPVRAGEGLMLCFCSCIQHAACVQVGLLETTQLGSSARTGANPRASSGSNSATAMEHFCGKPNVQN